MEPTILKTPSIYNGAGIYKTGAEGGGAHVGNLILTTIYNQANVGFFKTPIFDLESSNLIETNINCKANSFSYGLNYHDCGGQWWTGSNSFFIGIAGYIFSDKIELDYGNAVEENFSGISYNIGDVVNANTIYDKLNNKAEIKISYNETLVLEHEISLDDVILQNTSFVMAGTRFRSSTTYPFDGEIDLSKTYIKLDNDLVWGCDF